jgi:hypothetical protein
MSDTHTEPMRAHGEHKGRTPGAPYFWVCLQCGKVYKAAPTNSECAPHVLTYTRSQVVFRDGKVIGLRIPRD